MKTALFSMLLAACGSSSGSSTDSKTADTPNVPANITVTGTASERSLSGTNPVAGIVVAAYSNDAPTTVVAMTTTDASGNYTLTVPTMGKPVDGFFKATKSGYVDTYLYAPAPIIADFSGASLNMLSPGNFSLLSGTLCNANQDAAKGTIAVEVVQAVATSPTTIGGAMVTASPAATKYCYDQGGVPNKSATMTDTDGVAVMFNVTGAVTVSASMTGATFKSHTVNATAGAFTTTLITE
jgi:hypothetical protein